ncbi:MAG: serine/threonine protein kinase [Thiohalomonadales bacterium]
MTDIVNELPSGSLLEQYKIGKTLSCGGFSIVYFAIDTVTQIPVVIKEYLPNRLAKRLRDHRVAPLKPKLVEQFQEGRKLFFQEAKTLATLKHPNIVSVINFFNANGTVYMVMEYKPGKNLEVYIRQHQGNLSENFLRTIFPPLCEGLAVVHQAGLLHLDIKPGNIHLQNGGDPLLLDFGAVHEMSQSRQDKSVQVVTHGFSPIEQHNNRGYIGPWTDIYALGATMRSCIDARTPLCSRERHKDDTLRPAAEAFKRKYSPALLEAIDRAMEVDPELRPQSIDEFTAILNNEEGMAQHGVLTRLVGNLRWGGD